MSLKIAGAFAAAAIFFVRVKTVIAWCRDKWVKISPMIEPIIKDVEAAAADKIITREERKKIAMNAIALAEQKGFIKLNWLDRWIIGRIVDKIAQALPDIDMSQHSKSLVDEAIAQSKK